MKHTTKAILSLIFAAILAVAPAVAQEEDKSGFYVSPEVGQFKAGDICANLRRFADGTEQLSSCSDSEIGWGLSAGYWLNENFAIEGGGLFASGFDYTYTDIYPLGDPDGTRMTDVMASADYRSFFLGGVGRYPLGERFAVFAKAGIHLWDVEVAGRSEDTLNDGDPSNGLENSISIDTDGTDPYFGIGAEFKLWDNLAVQAEYTRYLADGEFGPDEDNLFEDVDAITASAVWKF